MSGYDEMVERLRFESQRLMDGAPTTDLQLRVVAALLSDAADAMEKQAQLVDRLAEECRAWMNGVADVVEPLGYDRVAACGPSDLLPGLTELRVHGMESARRLSECVEARSYLYEQVVGLSAQLDAARLNEIKPIAGPPDATDVELDSIGSSCDWGGCNDESVGLRWSPKFAGYLPVCFRHQGTLDAEGVCVRCGAPGKHCQCEDVADDGHWWVAPSVGANNTEWTVCQRCGNVKRQDGKPSSNCRGPVRVGLRQPNPFDEHTRMWEDEIRGMGLNPDHVKKIAAKAKPYVDHSNPRDPRSLPPFDPEVLDEVRRFYENNGREMQ